MKWYTYDTEVFKHDFIVVFKNKETGEYAVFHNDNDGVKDFITDDAVYCGFNSKGYDQYIIKAIVSGFYPEEVKQVNDWIISGNQGWQCPLLDGIYYRFNNVDISDDVQMGLSLKAIEGHLGMSIEETEVDFNISRPLTIEELNLTIKYCKHDVDATEELTKLRKDYLQTKLNLGKRANIDSIKALSSTNAKLTALMLNAKKVDRTDGRDYVIPTEVDQTLIPNEVLSFFDTIHDMSIPDDELFKTSLTIDIGDMPCKYAWGGVHGSLTGFHSTSQGTRLIQNRDVSSLYPSLIEEYNYLSRNVLDPQIFYDIKKDRIHAKHIGDKQTATDLKLPLNTVSGAQENQYNDLYDPLPTRSLRISGQLFLTMLSTKLLAECKTIKLYNLNTDGLMYEVDASELPLVDKICKEWEQATRFELETDDISKVWIKDVNNLLLIKTNGEVKTVGGYLNYGISVKGAWAINNNMTIVKKALIKYFTENIPVEETINNSNDIFEFQIIAKAGAKYKEAYHLVDGEKLSVQKVNRIYATTDERYGKIYKVKAENDMTAKIESLPEHCIIDNDNQLTIDKVDRQFYIDLAKKRINDYLGIKPEKKGRKKMAESKTTKAKNVYQKLLEARVKFLESNAKKSGKNRHLTFKYFELDDIVPTATKIFEEVGLLHLVSFENDKAYMQIVNIENPEESVFFYAPVVTLAENKGTNAVQAFGATMTYSRRYLYMLALDICEADTFDAGVAPPPTAPSTPTQTKPLTNADGKASDIQIKQLKEVMKKLKAADPSQEEFLVKIAIESNSFTNISKAECENLTKTITQMLNNEEEIPAL